MTIHKEGRRLLLTLLLILFALNTGLWLSGVTDWLRWGVLAASVFFYLLILQFFRHPKRHTPTGEGLVIAPADGKVVVIEETEEPECLKGKCRQISIFMSPFNVHVNRSPVEGCVRYYRYHEGKYLVAWHPKSSTENERTTLVLETPQKQLVLVRQIAGALAKRIKCYVKEGDQLHAGEEFGFIKFGSRVDVFLPLDAEILVNIGDKTKGGEQIIARLKSS
ncbi:phosphatidylserine decarboxylase [Thermonema lapsum]|uniref:Phosphatidylserine decarboxylase proenzyme n=1 Tax=Thermonema lapsum TaxID=28195 RepID=A0A846MP94_9BACT|nr:phosphatidylserine decarboxylase family protein [Thermonema lapsum]NIK73222.1 phosphatidylserine decarboxylase [Thermonema lapsum]